MTPVLVVVSNLVQVHDGKTVAYKKILGAMFSCRLVPGFNVLSTCFGSFGRRSQSLIVGGFKNKLSATTKTRGICMRKRSSNDEIPSTVDTLIRNAVLTQRTKLHRLPRGYPAGGWFLTLMICKHRTAGKGDRLLLLNSKSPSLLQPIALTFHRRVRRYVFPLLRKITILCIIISSLYAFSFTPKVEPPASQVLFVIKTIERSKCSRPDRHTCVPHRLLVNIQAHLSGERFS